MLDYAPSGDDSSTDSDDDLDGDFDLMDTNSGSLGSAGHPSNATPMESAAAISLLNHQKARFGARLTSRRPSSSSRNRSMMTPSPIIQPTRTLMMGGNSGGYEYPMGRRGSLTLGPSALEYEIDRPEHGVVRRAVSRRGSLLPKTKNFQRIKAALIEESSPIDLEVKREAEITRQIREEDGPHNCKSPQQTQLEGRPSTMESELANIGEEEGTESGDSTSQSTRGVAISFSKQAERHASGGFWFGDQMEGINGSPPTFPGLRMGSDGDIIVCGPEDQDSLSLMFLDR